MQESLRYFKIAADGGEVNSMYIYCLSLFQGKEIECEVEEGLKYIKLAADSKNVEAMLTYGLIKMKGEKV